jgi:8-oxo-dGTP pyrophosphatase MutT (NUDIX family)
MEVEKPKDYLDLINAVDKYVVFIFTLSERARKCAAKYPDSVPLNFDFNGLYKLLLPHDPRPHGFMTTKIVSQMPWTGKSIVIHHRERTVQIAPQAHDELLAEACTATFQDVVDSIVEADTFGITNSRHSESYRIMGSQYSGVHPRIERYPAPLFGISSRGAHMTCYVRDSASPAGLRIWVARRASHLFTYPGKLDTTVAGGIKSNDEPLDCIVAEADEEASLDSRFVRQNARVAGLVTYVRHNAKFGSITPVVLYVYDLELPPDMVLTPKDGEVAEFYLWEVEEVKEAMLREEFKPNCNLVMLDFFIRHGIVTPENEVNFVDIATRLRRSLPVPTTPLRREACR